MGRMPAEMSQAEERERFDVLCSGLGLQAAKDLHEKLETIEMLPAFPHAAGPDHNSGKAPLNGQALRHSDAGA